MNPSYELMDRAREEYARKGVLRQEYHRGYEAGKRARTPEQWQLDMERMEVARRVDAVTLDNGSHGNLSAIASAIYEPRFGWTSGACAMLRDTLVRLLGGAHERDCRGGRDDTGASCANNSDGEQAEEVNPLVNCGNPYKAGGAVLDSGGITQYDVLGNERHKAIAKLRNFEPMIGSKPTEEASKLIRCITGKSDSHVACGNDLEETRDRLIHLLGGDEPTLSDLWGMWKDADGTCPNNDGTCPNDGPTSSITGERHKAVCELRKLDGCSPLAHGFRDALAAAIDVPRDGAPYDDKELCHLICDRLIHLLGGDEPNFSEIAKTINLCDESDGELMENGESHKFGGRITEDLRWCVKTAHMTYDDMSWTPVEEGYNAYHTICHITEGDLLTIADRIDEQFDRICEQHEAVLQSTIDEMCDELDGLMANNAELTAKCEALMAANAGLAKGIDDARESEYRAERQRDELRDKFAEYDLQSRLEEPGDITMTHREMRRMLGEVKHLHDTLRARSNAMSQVTKERDELRRTCAELRRELEGGRHG